MIKKLILQLKSLFVKTPTKPLTWTVIDYQRGRRWAKSRPHPTIKGKTMWDYVRDPCDTVETINNINKVLFSKK